MQKPDEVYRDMARVPEMHRIDAKGKPISEGCICYVKAGGRRILLSLRGVAGASNAAIQIDEKTRNALVLTAGEEADFEFLRVSWLGQFLWAWRASEPAYRIPARLGLLSLVLGLIGLVLGAVSLAFSK